MLQLLFPCPGWCRGTHRVLVKCGHKGRRGGEGGRLAGGERVPRYIVLRAPKRRPQVSLCFPSCPCAVPHSSDWGAGPGCPARAPGSPPPRQAGACIFQSPGALWGDAPRTPHPAQCAEWKTAGRHVHAAGRRLHVDTAFSVLLGLQKIRGSLRRLNSQQADQKTLRLRVLRVRRGMAWMVVTFRTKFLLAKW